MNVTVDIQVAVESDESPDPHQIRSWLTAALERAEGQLHTNQETLSQKSIVQKSIVQEKTVQESIIQETEVSIRIVDADESRTLNHQYRGRDYATNVLSFASDLPADLPIRHLGDLVICAPVVKREALEQGKSLNAHWAHMVVHGTLHLLGFDHVDEAEAETMEGLETDIVTSFGFPPPYQSQLEANVNASVANQ